MLNASPAQRRWHEPQCWAATLGLVVTEHLVEGEPAAQIAHVADTIGADLIVLGSRGLDPAGRYVLGSVPERLLFDPHGHDVVVVRTTP